MDLKIYHDRIINTVNSIISNERDRASDAGEDRERIGALIEQIGVNKKAMSFAKALHKMEPEKRDDTLRSFDALRAEFEKNWNGQSTPDLFAADLSPAEPEFMDPDAELPKPSYEPTFTPGVDPELDAETDEFDRHLAEVSAQ